MNLAFPKKETIENETQFLDAYYKKHSNHHHMWLKLENKPEGKYVKIVPHIFHFYDENHQPLYLANNKASSFKTGHMISLEDSQQIEIGDVKELTFALRNPLDVRIANHIDLIITSRGQKLGKVKSQLESPFGMAGQLKIAFNGSHIRWVGNKMTVTSKSNKEIIEMLDNPWKNSVLTHIGYHESENPELVALYVLAYYLYDGIDSGRR